MLRSAIIAVRSAALRTDVSYQVHLFNASRLFGTQFRRRTQSSPNTNSSTEVDSEKNDSQPEKNTEDATEQRSSSERLLKEKEALIKDLQVCYSTLFVTPIHV